MSAHQDAHGFMVCVFLVIFGVFVGCCHIIFLCFHGHDSPKIHRILLIPSPPCFKGCQTNGFFLTISLQKISLLKVGYISHRLPMTGF